MKGSLYLLGVTSLIAVAVLCGGCITLPEQQLIDVAQREIKANGYTLTQADIQKAMPTAERIVKEFPGAELYWPTLLKVANAVAGGSTNVTAYTPPTGFLSAAFLENDASTRNMNRLSINATAAGWEEMLKRHKELGFNQVCLFLANEGDGGPVPTTFYRDAWFGAIDQDRTEMMRVRIQQAKAMGFAVELWGIPDDSPSLSRATPEQLAGFYADCAKLFGDLADSWCIGLEVDEWGERWWNTLWHQTDMKVVAGAVAALKATGKPVAVHLTHYKKIDMAHQSGADTFNAQFGWLKTPAQMAEAMTWINARKGNMRVVACEFNRDSTTPLATALATEAAKQGAAGTQTGRPK